MEKMTRSMIRSAEKVLADNGVDPLEVETVLQSLGYILFDKELYSAQTEVIERTKIDPFDYERDHQELKRPTTIHCKQEAARKLEDYAKSFLLV